MRIVKDSFGFRYVRGEHMLYAKVTPLPPREEVYGGEPIRCEVRTSPEDELVCVVEQSDEGITVSVVESAFPCSKIKTLEETASV